MEIMAGDYVEWVKQSRKGKSIEFRSMVSTVIEVRPEHVVIVRKNGRRSQLLRSAITAVNGVPVPAAETAVETPEVDTVAEVAHGN